MVSPKPISITTSDTNPGTYDPKPYVIANDTFADAVTAFLEGLTDFDAEADQTLQNLSGTLTWVDNT